jgi:hypothetical protein
MGSDELLTDAGPDCSSGARVMIAGLTDAVPDELLPEAVSGFGCEGGMTTADGRPVSAAGVAGNASPGAVVTLLDEDEPSVVAIPLDAVEAGGLGVGTLPAPGDPRPGKTVPS